MACLKRRCRNDYILLLMGVNVYKNVKKLRKLLSNRKYYLKIKLNCIKH